MNLPPARRMTSWAARSLTEEIAQLREDIHAQGMQLRNIYLLMQRSTAICTPATKPAAHRSEPCWKLC